MTYKDVYGDEYWSSVKLYFKLHRKVKLKEFYTPTLVCVIKLKY